MSGHTPGPWFMVGPVVVRPSDPVLIADLRKSGATWPQKNANARLIASAPDLLAAGRDALTALRDELESLLDSACGKDADGRPDRSDIDRGLEPYAVRLESAIRGLEDAITRATTGEAP